MSQELIYRNVELQKLQNEGYEIEAREGVSKLRRFDTSSFSLC